MDGSERGASGAGRVVKADRAREFWTWFAANERRLRTRAERPPEPVLDEVLEELRGYQDGLGFELFQDPKGDDRRFIVTAYGERALFPAVDALVEAAPADLAWRAIALKPEKGFGFVQSRDGRDYDPKEMAFEGLKTPGYPERIGLWIYMKDYDPAAKDEQWASAEVILMTALGERRYAEEIEKMGVAPFPGPDEDADPIPLVELPAYLTRHRKRHRLPP